MYAMSSFLPEQTMVTSGLSKIFGAGGWRLGFAALPSGDSWRTFSSALSSLMSETISGVQVPTQRAAMAAYREKKNICGAIIFGKPTLCIKSRLDTSGIVFSNWGLTVQSPKVDSTFFLALNRINRVYSSAAFDLGKTSWLPCKKSAFMHWQVSVLECLLKAFLCALLVSTTMGQR